MATRLGGVTVVFEGDIRDLEQKIGKSQGLLKGFAGKAGSFMGGALQDAVGGAILGGVKAAVDSGIGLIKGALDEAMQAELVGADTAAVLKSTGGAAGMTAKAIEDLAKAMSEVTRFDDETVQSGENMLLTFTKIGKDVFPQATEAMLNMATKMGIDPKTAAIQLGKALNDPIKGITALRRVGVAFTKDQELQIKAMVKAGDVMGAQKLILAELNTEFGGAARAAGGTFAGQMDILRNKLSNVKEQIGTALIPALTQGMQQLGPVLMQAVGGFADWFEREGAAKLGQMVTWLSANLPAALATAGTIWSGFVAKLREFSTWWTANGAPVVGQIATWLGIHVPKAVQTLTVFWETKLMPALRALGDHFRENILPDLRIVAEWFKEHIPLAIEFLKEALSTLLEALGWLWEKITLVVGKLDEFVGRLQAKLPDNPFGVIAGWVGGLIDRIKEAVSWLQRLLGMGGGRAPAYASGTLSAAGGMALVGEQGPEIVSLPRGARVWPNGTGPGGGGMSVVININAPGGNPAAIGAAARTGVLQAARSMGMR